MKRIRSILVATDLTEGSDRVLHSASVLAAGVGAELHLLHVVEVDHPPPPSRPPPPIEAWTGGARDRLEEQIERVFPDHDVLEPTSRRILVGRAHPLIIDRAREVKADLIAIGKRRLRSVGDYLFGSTTDRVIRASRVPCLVVASDMALPLGKILIPMDLSDPEREDLDRMLEWGAVFGGAVPHSPVSPGPEITVIHVAPPVYRAPDSRTGDASFGADVIAPEIRSRIEDARRRTGIGPDLVIREAVHWGKRPAAEIARVAREEETELIVLATRGRGAIGRLVLGSVASEVATEAPCPILLLPPMTAG